MVRRRLARMPVDDRRHGGGGMPWRRVGVFAVVRETTYDPQKRTEGQAQAAEFWHLRALQPGYRGDLVIDAGAGRTLTVAFWDSEAQAQAAGEVLTPEAERLLAPMWTRPARIIASGPVVRSDLIEL